MANVEHNALTGASLHEPKGVAAAGANLVYLSNGATSGAWSLVPLAALTSSAKAFEAQLFHVRDQRSSGVAPQSLTTATQNVRTLQTVVTNEISGASLATNQITLPAGTYWLDGWAQLGAVSSATSLMGKTRIRNVTDSTTTLVGANAFVFVAAGTGTGITAPVRGRFTIASTKVFELQMFVTGANGLGGAEATSGDVEVYAEVCIWKIA